VHGRRRLTEDVDILIGKQDLTRFKAVRDTMADVKIDFLLVGDFPGDGKPKPIAFPVPPADCLESSAYRVLPLQQLVELKLASGMSAAHRAQDLVDVMELVRARDLPRDFANELHPYVRAAFDQQWQLAHVVEDY
jgi:hypothetical protein